MSRTDSLEEYVSYDGLKPELDAMHAPSSRVHINRMIRAGLFPAGTWVSPNRRVWTRAEIEAWKAQRLAGTNRPVVPPEHVNKRAPRGTKKAVDEKAVA